MIHFAAAVEIGQRPLAAYFRTEWLEETLTILLLPAIGWSGFIAWVVWRRGIDRPLSAIRRIAYLDRGRLGRAFLFLLLFILVDQAYRALKVAIPRLHEYYADPYLARLDRLIFGTDPWRLTHALIGPRGTEVLDLLYVLWFLVMIGLFAWAAFARDKRFQLQAVATYFLIWIVLGNAMAGIFASAGPCYYERFFHSEYFAPLMEQLRHTGDLRALALQDYLYASLGQESIGSGISAFPSIHVAMTSLLVIVTWNRFGAGWQAALALTYHLCILVGSVHLGWHYGVDGIASMITTAILWRTVGMLLEWGEAAGSPGAPYGRNAVPA